MIRVTPAVKAAWDALPRPLNSVLLRMLIEQIVSPSVSTQVLALQAKHEAAIAALAQRILAQMRGSGDER